MIISRQRRYLKSDLYRNKSLLQNEGIRLSDVIFSSVLFEELYLLTQESILPSELILDIELLL